MKERPILFSAPMVRALLDGSKTQTRRVVKPQPIYDGSFAGNWKIVGKNGHEAATCSPLVGELCPHGRQDDQLWVRENFCPIYPQDPTYNGGRPIEYDYAATYQHGNRLGDFIGIKKRWKPSIHMPRAASRITLEITSVRVEHVQDISEEDALAEGIVPLHEGFGLPDGSHFHASDPGESYLSLWDAVNGEGSAWNNPWVWVIEFKRVEGAKP